MGCNESRSQGQPIAPLGIYNQRLDRVGNEGGNEVQMIDHVIANETAISHQAIIFEQNVDQQSHQMSKSTKKEKAASPKLKPTNSLSVQQKQSDLNDNNQNVEIIDTPTLIQAIGWELNVNKFYNSIFETSHLQQMLQFVKNRFISRQSNFFVLELLLTFLKKTHNIANNSTNLQMNSFQALVVGLATDWQKLKTFIISEDKNNSKMVSYILPKKQSQQKNYSHCYLELKFQKSFNESSKILEVVRQLIKFEENAFCFYTNYLVKCCQRMQVQGRNVSQIQMILQEHCQAICNQIDQETGANKKTQITDEANNLHKTFKNKLKPQQKKYYSFDNESSSSKQEQLETFMNGILIETSQFYNKLLEFIQDLCLQENYEFFCYQMKNDEQSVFELKQSTFSEVQFQKYKSDSIIETQPLAKYIQNELQSIKAQKIKIYQFMSGNIEFKASCMLQARCIFQNLLQLNKCADKIRELVDKKQYTLIEIKNNLNSQKGVRSLTIVFAVGTFKMEIKLVLNYKLAQLILREYLNSIVESKMCTILTALYLLNKSLTHKFMVKMYPIIVYEIYRNNKENYQKFIIPTQFKQLLKLWQITLPIDSFSQIKGQYQKDSCFLKLKKDFESVKSDKVSLSKEDKLVKLYNKIRYEAVDNSQNQNLQLQLQLFKTYISQQQSQSYNKEISQQMRNRMLAYSKCLALSAQKSMIRKNYTKAEELAKEYMELIAILGQELSLQTVKMRKNLALCEYFKNNFNQALKLFKECIQLINKCSQDKSKFKIEKIQMQKELAIIYKEQGNNFKALNTFNDILQEIHSSSLKQEELQCAVLKNIASLLIKNSEYQDSLIYLSKALKVIQKKSGKDSLESIPIMISIGQAQEMQGKYQDALAQYKKCQSIIKMRKPDNQSLICEVYEHMGKVYIQLLLYQQAQQVFKKCLNVIQRQKGVNSTEYGEIAFTMGKLYLNLRNYQLSLKNLFKALSIREKTYGKETVKCLDILQEITQVYKSMRQYKNENHYINKVNSILKQEKQKVSISYLNTYNQIADKSQNKGNYAVALDYYSKSINILEKLKKKGSLEAVGIHQSIANIYREQEHYSAASQHYQKSLQILQSVKGKDSVERAELICEIGKLYELQNKSDTAMDYYQQCYNLCIRYKVKYRVYAICCYRLGKLCEKNGQQNEAAKYWRECLPIYEKMSAKQTQEIKSKLQKMQKQRLDR